MSSPTHDAAESLIAIHTNVTPVPEKSCFIPEKKVDHEGVSHTITRVYKDRWNQLLYQGDHELHAVELLHWSSDGDHRVVVPRGIEWRQKDDVVSVKFIQLSGKVKGGHWFVLRFTQKEDDAVPNYTGPYRVTSRPKRPRAKAEPEAEPVTKRKRSIQITPVPPPLPLAPSLQEYTREEDVPTLLQQSQEQTGLLGKILENLEMLNTRFGSAEIPMF